MTSSTNSWLSGQLLDCMAAGWGPRPREPFSQAECIRIKEAAGQPAFSWGQLALD